MRSTRSVGAGDVEGVGARARRVRRAVVERVEVVVHGLDLRPLHHGEAEPEEDVFELAAHARQQVQAPDRLRRRAGQRHVDAIRLPAALELLAAELLGARLDQRLERLARLVGGLADRAALLGRQLGDAAQQLRQLGLAPEVAHAQLLAAARRRSPPAISASACARSCSMRSIIVRRTLDEPGRARAPRVISYSATVAAIAAFSDSDAIGIRALRSHAATTSRGRPSRSAPTSSVSGAARRPRRPRRARRPARAALGGVGDQRDALAGQRRDVLHARERDREDRAHARAHGLRRVRVGAAAARARRTSAPNALRRAQRSCRRCPGRRRRAGTRTAARAGARPALLVDADHARARAERRDALSASRVDVVKALLAEPSSPRGDSPRPRRARPRAPRARGPRPRPRSARCARARARVAQPLEVLQPWVCGWRCMWCHSMRSSVADLAVVAQKKRRPFRNDAREAKPMSIAGVRQPTPRGRPRQNVGTCRRRARRCRRAPCGRARRRPASGRA